MPGCHTVLGVSNISFGLSPAARQVLNSVFLADDGGRRRAGCRDRPCRAKILPLHKIDDEARQVCTDLIYDRRSEGYDPLHRLMELFEGASESRASRGARGAAAHRAPGAAHHRRRP
jgi:5-methyltetrahydrofolate--homocysteine methyltransferase